MRHLHEVEVPAGGEVSFEPGALHVMPIGLMQPLVGGESFRPSPWDSTRRERSR